MARERLVWAIDCDDVIVNTAPVLIGAYNEQYGTDVSLSAFYDRESTWGASSHAEAIKRVDALLRGGITDNLAPDQETVDVLRYLASKDELHMVTGRQSFLEPATHRMLDEHLPGIFTSVEHTNYYSAADSQVVSRTKGEVCAQIGADVLLDDHVEHGVSVLESGLSEVIVWGDHPWNRHQKLRRGMVRCVRWSEVLHERERILAGR